MKKFDESNQLLVNAQDQVNDGDRYHVDFDARSGHLHVYMPSIAGSSSSEQKNNSTSSSQKYINNNCNAESTNKIPEEDNGPSSNENTEALQYQQHLRKVKAEQRATNPSPAILSKLQSQKPIYLDEHMVVVSKPSGLLSVPGLNNNPSVLQYVYDTYGPTIIQDEKDTDSITSSCNTNDNSMNDGSSSTPSKGKKKINNDTVITSMDQMVVHRLDMDTSGLLLFARNKPAMKHFQTLFRERSDTISKVYEAVVCGHLAPSIQKGTIDLPLQRDHRFPPFMRVSTQSSDRDAREVIAQLHNEGYKKILMKKPKQSKTHFRVIERAYLSHSNDDERLAVTRLELVPVTGRTHQLRVHCAALGHPIIGDSAYGLYGEACPNGGFESEQAFEMMVFQNNRAKIEIQQAFIDRLGEFQYINQEESTDTSGVDEHCNAKGRNYDSMHLHARRLTVTHPVTGESMDFVDDPIF